MNNSLMRQYAGNFFSQFLDVTVNGSIADNTVVRIDFIY